MVFALLNLSRFLICCYGDSSDNASVETPSVAICGRKALHLYIDWTIGTLTDKAVKTAKRRATEDTLAKVQIENNVVENVYSFEYLGSRLQRDGDGEADVRYRMDIAQAAFAPLSHLWMDHRLTRNMMLSFIIPPYAPDWHTHARHGT